MGQYLDFSCKILKNKIKIEYEENDSSTNPKRIKKNKYREQ